MLIVNLFNHCCCSLKYGIASFKNISKHSATVISSWSSLVSFYLNNLIESVSNTSKNEWMSRLWHSYFRCMFLKAISRSALNVWLFLVKPAILASLDQVAIVTYSGSLPHMHISSNSFCASFQI